MTCQEAEMGGGRVVARYINSKALAKNSFTRDKSWCGTEQLATVLDWGFSCGGRSVVSQSAQGVWLSQCVDMSRC